MWLYAVKAEQSSIPRIDDMVNRRGGQVTAQRRKDWTIHPNGSTTSATPVDMQHLNGETAHSQSSSLRGGGPQGWSIRWKRVSTINREPHEPYLCHLKLDSSNRFSIRNSKIGCQRRVANDGRERISVLVSYPVTAGVHMSHISSAVDARPTI